MGIKDIARRIMPAALRRWRTRLIRAHLRRRNAARTAEEVFSDIYAKNLWGGAGKFCSGSGSNERQTGTYVAFVRNFIRQRGITSIVDLGCGDFRVAARIIDRSLIYTGIDVVPALVEHNIKVFGNSRVRFMHLDIANDDLPCADLCIIRQVLQHLSNAQIQAILGKLAAFKVTLITEHYPNPDNLRLVNVDKVHGADVRLYDGSGVYFDHAPFNIANLELVLEESVLNPVVGEGETLRTFLIDGPPVIRSDRRISETRRL